MPRYKDDDDDDDHQQDDDEDNNNANDNDRDGDGDNDADNTRDGDEDDDNIRNNAADDDEDRDNKPNDDDEEETTTHKQTAEDDDEGGGDDEDKADHGDGDDEDEVDIKKQASFDDMDTEAEDEVPDAPEPSTNQMHDLGELVVKQLIAQLVNAYNPDTSSHLNSSHVHSESFGPGDLDDEDVADEDTGDWRLLKLTTHSARDGRAHTIQAKLDTGADDNLVQESVAKVMGLKVSPWTGGTFVVGSGEELAPKGVARLVYTINGKKYAQNFQVLENLPHEMILGGPFLVKSHMITFNLPQKQKKKDFLLYEIKKSSPQEMKHFTQQRQSSREAEEAARKLVAKQKLQAARKPGK